jgi:hypothetical protein
MNPNLNSGQFGLPPEPGTAPIPEGHDRYYHQTDPSNVPSIREHGLLYDKGRGVEGPKGVWISHKPFYQHATDAAMVEMHLPHHPDRGHIASIGDVHPSNFVAIHEPWHDHARYMLQNEDVKQRVISGEHDDLLDFPDYGPAIQHVKNLHARGEI